jgi:hypothetical protein
MIRSTVILAIIIAAATILKESIESDSKNNQ